MKFIELTDKMYWAFRNAAPFIQIDEPDGCK
jgi:hypothetical protein